MQKIAEERRMTYAAVVNQALREFLDRDRQLGEITGLEKRLVGSMTRVMKDVRLVRNDLHLTMAFVNTLAEIYLLHTPPLPDTAVGAAAASATERYQKFVKRVIAQLQGGEGLWADLMTDSGDRDESGTANGQ
jgi:hypothetical protein